MILGLIGVFFSGCGQPEGEIAIHTSTIIPSPTSTQTLVPEPSSTLTVEPTSTPIPTQTATREPPQEVTIREIPLTGPINSPDAQISGMAWHGDTLVILPQYPEKNLLLHRPLLLQATRDIGPYNIPRWLRWMLDQR